MDGWGKSSRSGAKSRNAAREERPRPVPAIMPVPVLWPRGAGMLACRKYRVKHALGESGRASRERHRGARVRHRCTVVPDARTGITYYGTVFVLQQALTLAAEEGARAALRYPLTSTGGTTALHA
jgi:hypothetical protein